MRRLPEEAPGCTTPITNNGASSNDVANQSTTLDKEKQCEQLHRQWAEAEYQHIMRSLQVDTVTGSIGPLYYCQLLVAGQPVTALVDSFSSATIMSLVLFQEVAKIVGFIVIITSTHYALELSPIWRWSMGAKTLLPWSTSMLDKDNHMSHICVVLTFIFSSFAVC